MNRYEFIDTKERCLELGLELPRRGLPHIHTLDGKALKGTTTVKKIIGKGDAIPQWYADKAAVAALKFPAIDIEAEYLAACALSNKIERAKAKKELDKKYPQYLESRMAATNSRDESAESGTERHGLLEAYIKDCLVYGGRPQVLDSRWINIKDFVDWSFENVDHFLFTEAHCYHEGLWVGGITDAGMVLKDGQRLVGDHKSSKEAYDDQFLQCATYDVLLQHSGGLDSKGNKLFDWEPADGYVVFPFGSNPFTPEFRWNAQDFRKGVEAMCYLENLILK